MTFEELNQKWIEDQVTDGNPLQRSTFNRHRDAILNIVGLIIECDQANGYKYYIANPEVLEDDSIERWLSAGADPGDETEPQDRDGVSAFRRGTV